MSDVKVLLSELADAVVAGDVHKARKLAQKMVDEGLSADAAVERMMEAMRVVDRKFERKEYFTVDVAAASSAMREAFRILEPNLKPNPADVRGKVVIGSLKGNIQGLGKDIVAAALRSAGFHVVDLGVDVSPEAFVESAVREKARIIAISVSLRETVPHLKEVAALLQQRKLTAQIKTVIGGRAVSEQTPNEYGLNAYAKDAAECVEKVKELLKE